MILLILTKRNVILTMMMMMMVVAMAAMMMMMVMMMIMMVMIIMLMVIMSKDREGECAFICGSVYQCHNVTSLCVAIISSQSHVTSHLKLLYIFTYIANVTTT